MKQIAAYECEFCGKYAKTKAYIKKHEGICFKNPAVRACAGCKHNVQELVTVYNPYHNGDPGSTDYEKYSAPYCTHHEKELTRKVLTTNCPFWKPIEP